MKEYLQELGFTPYEAEIYLCLLKNGQLTAYQVSEKTGLYRQACYDALNRMIEKGHVSPVMERRTKLFNATNPQALLDEIRLKGDTFEQILPQLMGLQTPNPDKVTVEVYKGQNIIRVGFRDSINVLRNNPTEVLCTAVDEWHYVDIDELPLKVYAREMERLKLRERVIIKEGAKGFMPPEVSTYRTVPDKFFNPNPVQIYGDTVMLVISGSPHYLILIRSQGIADSFRKQFELMWSVAKPMEHKTP